MASVRLMDFAKDSIGKVARDGSCGRSRYSRVWSDARSESAMLFLVGPCYMEKFSELNCFFLHGVIKRPQSVF